MNRWYAVVKRTFDLAGSAAALAAAAPLLGVCAAGVRLDSKGPVLFRQRRLGRHGKIFELLKFRTMRPDAGVIIGTDRVVVNPVDDPRVTRVGRWLRRWSLDELPQLLNVLRGEMSLVGPRPDLPEALQMYDSRQRRKLEVRPGLTGLAQVSGRNRLGADEKWGFDVRYAECAGPATDLRILARTVWKVLRRDGVYKEE